MDGGHLMRKTPMTINVSLEFTQTPSAKGRLLAAYKMLFGETRLGDNPVDRTISHPIMPHVDNPGAVITAPRTHK